MELQGIFIFNERELLFWAKLGDAQLDLVLLLRAQLYTEEKKKKGREEQIDSGNHLLQTWLQSCQPFL